MLTDKRLNFPERLLALPLTAVEGGGTEAQRFRRLVQNFWTKPKTDQNALPILDKTKFSIESPHRFKKQC